MDEVKKRRDDETPIMRGELCRGVHLGQFEKELKRGGHREEFDVGAVGGLSTNLMACRRFARGLMDAEKEDKIPLVIIFDKYVVSEANNHTLQPIPYENEEYLMEHPEILRLIDTLKSPVYQKLRTDRDRLLGAQVHKDEEEWYVPGKFMKTPKKAIIEIRVYLSPQSLITWSFENQEYEVGDPDRRSISSYMWYGKEKSIDAPGYSRLRDVFIHWMYKKFPKLKDKFVFFDCASILNLQSGSDALCKLCPMYG